MKYWRWYKRGHAYVSLSQLPTLVRAVQGAGAMGGVKRCTLLFREVDSGDSLPPSSGESKDGQSGPKHILKCR